MLVGLLLLYRLTRLRTFGTTGSLEGVWAAKYGNLVSLSEQQIVGTPRTLNFSANPVLDCAWTDDIGQGNSGCDGGFAAPAMQWIMNNGGIALQNDYKYLMVDGWCKAAIKTSRVKVQGYVNVTMNSEAALQHAGMKDPLTKEFTLPSCHRWPRRCCHRRCSRTLRVLQLRNLLQPQLQERPRFPRPRSPRRWLWN